MMAGKTKKQLLEEIEALERRTRQLEGDLASQGRTGKAAAPQAGDQRAAEAALRESEIRYRRLFETAKDGILILDAESGTITDSNPFLEQLLGYSHAELLGRRLWEIGPFSDVAASQVSFLALQSNEYIRYEDLPLETKSGDHRQVEFISNLYLADGRRVIQCNIRDITVRKASEAAARQASEALASLVSALRRRDGELTLLGRMNDLLQTSESQEEAYRVIALLAAELFAGQGGCLAIAQESGQYLETVSRWGRDTEVEDVFPLKDCWALRRGRAHEVVRGRPTLLCAHFARVPEHGYRCLPLTVQGETLGIFHLTADDDADEEQRSSRERLAFAVGETIKLSLANLKLRRKLHEQATRDPLTGLFNRRYLDETLPRELLRALRRGAPLCVAMLDLDHFKRFNDTFGHDAGDLVLRESTRVLSDRLRRSDIACRYGGEEVVLVMPDSSLADTVVRVDQIRALCERLQIRHEGQLLAATTFSAGVAAAPEHATTPGELLRAADEAMYAAKQAGRNRVVAYAPRT